MAQANTPDARHPLFPKNVDIHDRQRRQKNNRTMSERTFAYVHPLTTTTVAHNNPHHNIQANKTTPKALEVATTSIKNEI